MNPRYIFASCVALLATAAIADENPVYESLAGVEIGRVFLSREQRAVLDHKRKHPASDTAPAAGVSPAQEAPPAVASPAGYIIGRNGQSKVWKDGDFVSSPTPRDASLSFPGDVQIIQHAADDDG